MNKVIIEFIKTNWFYPWTKAFSSKRFQVIFTITLILLVVSIYSMSSFLLFIESRPGAKLNEDPILSLINPIQLNWTIFALEYFSLLLGFLLLSRKPEKLIVVLQSYIFLLVFRAVAMYLTPFDPPLRMIPLIDPLVEVFSKGEVLTRDLFFSGHTSTMALLFFSSYNQKQKLFFGIATVFVGILILLQHVHYSIDVFAAPYFAYAAYSISKFVYKKVSYDSNE